MRPVHRWLVVGALSFASACVYSIGASSTQLLSAFDALGHSGARTAAAVSETHAVPLAPAPAVAGANPTPAALPATELTVSRAQLVPADGLTGAQIMRLLEDEIASETDPSAADEFLRAFRDSVQADE